MKKNMLFILTIMLFSVFAQGLSLDAPTIGITFMNQDPDPVGPGDYVEVRFKVSNNNVNSIAENLQMRVDSRYPFSLIAGEEEITEIGDLSGLGDEENVVVVKYKLKVDEDAVEGESPLRIQYKYGSVDWITKEFDLDIQTRDANLAIISVTTEPEKIKPGDEALVKVKVKNMADSTMKDVTLKLDLTYSGILSTATATASDSLTVFNTLPFAPIGSASEQKIFSLKPEEEYEFEYKLITYSDAESKVYKVPIIITYYDELETQYLKSDVIGLVVGSQPDMSIILDDADLYVGKKSGIVTIRFINKGFSDVKFLDVFLTETEEYEVLSVKEVYVGNVDSDDYETAEFTIYLNNGASKEEKTIILPLDVNYRDANNNVYEETHNLELKVLNPEKLGIKQSSGFTGLFVLVLIGGVVFFYFKRRKKKK